MITEAELTVATVHARAVNITLERPVQTSGGEIPTTPLVLIDLETREGATGRAYVFSYTTFALEPLRQLVENLGKALEGDAVAPLEIERKLQGMLRLLGPQGLTASPSPGLTWLPGTLWRGPTGYRSSSYSAARRREYPPTPALGPCTRKT